MIKEKVSGIVERVSYQNMDTGWSILRVRPFDKYGESVKVVVYQLSVFAGATMEFSGVWTIHPRYGKQFKAEIATELKPATTNALEKYLGSGLIKGVGPKTAGKIVRYFKEDTLEVFEKNIERLIEVRGIAEKKLLSIQKAWLEHRAIRDVMMFLQSHGISTLFAVRIYKQYGDKAISLVSENPYRLAQDFYGIGFLSADKIALSLGFQKDSHVRITAAIRHVLSASREQGHCYLTEDQINKQVSQLLDFDVGKSISKLLVKMEKENLLRVRGLIVDEVSDEQIRCYYSKTLYYDEEYVAARISCMIGQRKLDKEKIHNQLIAYEKRKGIILSDEQSTAVAAILGQQCSVLTGGPGCGKTTATKTLVDLLLSLGSKINLAAPTGRAAQRMSEVIGLEAKTIHRLLEYQGGGFKRNEEYPLEADFVVVDESSMLDINLTASLLKAVAKNTAILFIGDADQLPSVGAGRVLSDLIASGIVPCFKLTKIFRQARNSFIIRYAHLINNGQTPAIDSPFKRPELWQQSDCFFIDSDIASQEELRFITRIKKQYQSIEQREQLLVGSNPYDFETSFEPDGNTGQYLVPERFRHVRLNELFTADSAAEELMAVQKKIHPWSSLYFNLTAIDVIKKLYSEWIPKYFGNTVEIQILSPMIRGSLGTAHLNKEIQQVVNPPVEGKREIRIGERTFRVGDRVIHRLNNYDLGVFNGDIGRIIDIDNINLSCEVAFYPDNHKVEYNKDEMTELEVAYAITVHKSQGSEFDAVILPVFTQHFRMLIRNLLYTGLTRAKKLAVFVGTRRALTMAVRNRDTSKRQTALIQLLREKNF